MSSAGGGGGAPVAPVFTDPVNGKTFSGTYPGQGSTSRTVTNPETGVISQVDSPNELSAQEALNQEIEQRMAQEKAAADAKQATAAQTTAQAKTDADAATAKARSDFDTRFGQAKQSATDNANAYFTQQGYDPNRFASDLARAISTQSQGVPDLSASPITAFSPTLGASIIADQISGKRNQANSHLDALFSPSYAQDNVSDSWLDPAIGTTIASQFDPLSSQLENSHKRGTLNDVGYQAALKSLSDKQTTAGSTVRGLGNNILAADRTGVNDYITKARGDVGNLSLDGFDKFDPNSYATGAASKVAGYKDSFAGDLKNAVGSTSFADLPGLLNAGGAVQGANDPTATNPTGAGGAGPGISDSFIAQQALANKRGLGSTGAF